MKKKYDPVTVKLTDYEQSIEDALDASDPLGAAFPESLAAARARHGEFREIPARWQTPRQRPQAPRLHTDDAAAFPEARAKLEEIAAGHHATLSATAEKAIMAMPAK